MLIIEALLLTALTATLAVTIYTDCKNSIIHNKTILIAITIGFILDGIYYGFFAQHFFLLFIKNLVVVILAAFFFYCYHLWAAGDSKLFFAVGLFVPARFYTFWKIGSVPCFVILILVFSIAFIYVIGESVVLGFRQKKPFEDYGRGSQLSKGCYSISFDGSSDDDHQLDNLESFWECTPE